MHTTFDWNCRYFLIASGGAGKEALFSDGRIFQRSGDSMHGSSLFAPLGTCDIVFKVYFADDSVISLDSEIDPRLFATFGSAPIIRFHGYMPGNSYCVYELLIAFAMPVNVISIGDLIAAGIQSLTQPEERALLATLFQSSNRVGLRVYRFLRATGKRDHVRLLEDEPVADP